jgi:hypothetical protein
VRKSEYIVNKLLEAGSNGTTILFGPRQNGTRYNSLEQAVKHVNGQQMDTAQGMERMLSEGYSFFIQKNPNDIGFFSRNPRVYAAEGAADYVAQMFQLRPEAKVVWKPALKAADKMLALNTVFVANAVPTKVSEARLSEPAVSFGFGADKRQSNNGVVVAIVYKGSAAAKAGLQAGDRIVQVGPFDNQRGTYGPWRVRNVKDFKRACQYVQAGSSVPLRFIRGDGSFTKAVWPEEPAQVATAPDLKQAVQDLEHLTVDEIANRYKKTPEEVHAYLARVGGRAKDYVPAAPKLA